MFPPRFLILPPTPHFFSSRHLLSRNLARVGDFLCFFFFFFSVVGVDILSFYTLGVFVVSFGLPHAVTQTAFLMSGSLGIQDRQSFFFFPRLTLFSSTPEHFCRDLFFFSLFFFLSLALHWFWGFCGLVALHSVVRLRSDLEWRSDVAMVFVIVVPASLRLALGTCVLCILRRNG